MHTAGSPGIDRSRQIAFLALAMALLGAVVTAWGVATWNGATAASVTPIVIGDDEPDPDVDPDTGVDSATDEESDTSDHPDPTDEDTDVDEDTEVDDDSDVGEDADRRQESPPGDDRRGVRSRSDGPPRPTERS